MIVPSPETANILELATLYACRMHKRNVGYEYCLVDVEDSDEYKNLALAVELIVKELHLLRQERDFHKA